MTVVHNMIFALNISLLLLHEMDAVKCPEWKLLGFLRKMKNENVYRAFTLLHLPFYFGFLFYVFSYGVNETLFIYIDIFLVIHSILHIAFRNAADSSFTKFSYAIIHSMGLLALVQLLCIVNSYC